MTARRTIPPAVLAAYAEKDARVRVFRQENQGQAVARNKGLEAVTAPYVMFVDSDDCMSGRVLERTLAEMQEDAELDIVLFPLMADYEEREGYPFNEDAEELQYMSRKLRGKYRVTSWLMSNCPVSPWGKLHRMDIIRRHGVSFPEGLVYEDQTFFYEYMLHARNACFITDQTYYYLQRGDSTMGRGTTTKTIKGRDLLMNFDCIYRHYETCGALAEHAQLLDKLLTSYLTSACKNVRTGRRNGSLELAQKLAAGYDPSLFRNGLVENLRQGSFNRIPCLNQGGVGLKDRLFSLTEKDGALILRFLGMKVRCGLRANSEIRELRRKVCCLEGELADLHQRIKDGRI